MADEEAQVIINISNINNNNFPQLRGRAESYRQATVANDDLSSKNIGPTKQSDTAETLLISPSEEEQKKIVIVSPAAGKGVENGPAMMGDAGGDKMNVAKVEKAVVKTKKKSKGQKKAEDLKELKKEMKMVGGKWEY